MNRQRLAPRPRGYEMSEEQAEALRATVPDDPIRLPDAHLACDGCGVAVPVTDGDAVAEVHPVTSRTNPVSHNPVGFTCCPDCAALHERAEQVTTEHPVLLQRLGNIAADHVHDVLNALDVLGQGEPADWLAALRHLQTVGRFTRWADPTEERRGLCSPYRWAHVPLSRRAAIRSAVGSMLRERVVPTTLPACPSGGCLLCGIGKARSWRAHTASPDALGTRGPGLVVGHLCPECAEVVESEGAVGPSARERLIVAQMAQTVNERFASQLRDAYDTWVQPPPSTAWGAHRYVARRDGRPLPQPNATPWAHLTKAFARL